MRKRFLLACIVMMAVTAGCSQGEDVAVPPSAPPQANEVSTPAPDVPADAGDLPMVEPWSGKARDLAPVPVQLCSIDAINGRGSIEGVFFVAPGEGVTIEGWAATEGLNAPARVQLYLEREGGTSIRITGATGESRQDVAQAVGPGLANSGFRIPVSDLGLPGGEYEIWVGHESQGMSYACGTSLRLAVDGMVAPAG
ncbi:MAG: hypothetical protein M3451_03045 [Chloroflexota bacterium]|nr:hypothetical protein [Chloroflexota bacterium]